MTPQEATWLSRQILMIPRDHVSPLVNIGCSDLVLLQQQPWLETVLLGPLRAHGIEIINVDLKSAPNIDIVGDIGDEGVRAEISRRGARAVLCSNLLEHVVDPTSVARQIARLVPSGGYLFVSGPTAYPNHPDPIDNGLRVGPAGFAELFGNVADISSARIDCGTFWPEIRGRRLRWVGRLFVPFIRFSDWRLQVERIPWAFGRRYVFSCVVFRVL